MQTAVGQVVNLNLVLHFMVEREKYSRQDQASVKWETVILNQSLEQGAKPGTPWIPSAFGEN